jgi:DNA gyrase subunit A
LGQAIRFAVTDVRVFKGRDSTGVRGIRLADGDEVISMAILHHVDAEPAEREAYIKKSNLIRRFLKNEGEDGSGDLVAIDADEAGGDGADLSPERYGELGDAEQFILTTSVNGYGKRTSSYEYRVTGRGGKGIIAMSVSERNGKLIASFPVEDTDQIMLVTDGGKLIRCPVEGISILGRSTQGVTIFSTAKDEKVVSVERIGEVDDDGEDSDEADDPVNGAGDEPS